MSGIRAFFGGLAFCVLVVLAGLVFGIVASIVSLFAVPLAIYGFVFVALFAESPECESGGDDAR